MNIHETPENKTSPKQRHFFTTFFTFIAVLGVIGLGCFSYIADKRAVALQASLLAEQANTQLLSVQVKNLQALLGQDEHSLNARLDLLSSQLKAYGLRVDHLDGTPRWQALEARFLLGLADEKLQAFQDIDSAKAMLIRAQEKIQAAATPVLNSVSDALKNDIAKLESIKRVDSSVLWQQLNQVSDAVSGLTYKDALNKTKDNIQRSTKKSGWEEALDKTWDELKGLIKVRDLSHDMNVQDVQHVVKTIHYQIEQAKWALVNKRSSLYMESLQALQKTLSESFIANEALKKVKAQVDVLMKTPVEIQIPKLQSMQALDLALQSSQSPQPQQLPQVPAQGIKP